MADNTVTPLLIRTLRAALLCVLAAGGVGCIGFPKPFIKAVPGSESVRVTSDPADVTGCTAVGNVAVPGEVWTDYQNPDQQALNEVIGLGGNVLFATRVRSPDSGVAYRCASPAAATTPTAH